MMAKQSELGPSQTLCCAPCFLLALWFSLNGIPFLPLRLANSLLSECSLLVTSSRKPTLTSWVGFASPHPHGPPSHAPTILCVSLDPGTHHWH